MVEWSSILAGPGLDGFGDDPATRIIVAIALLFMAAVLCVMTHEFRLTMKHPPMKRGLIYRIAVGVIFSVAWGWAVWAFILRLFSNS